jgi:phage-related minor tail protein
MDIDKEINAIKKLIPSATGERLTKLNQRLTFLISKQQEQERVKLA